MTEYGVVTRNAEELTWPEFDLVSCFGDNAVAEADPEAVPLSDEGERATRERPYFDWAYVCPTHEAYREGLAEIIDDCVDANEDVRLDDVGFPRAEYCYCERCTRQFEVSGFDDRFAWRAQVITDFVAETVERIPGRVYLTLYPDPYPGHLYRRAGIDVDALAEHVDEFVVPLYDRAYATTYWLEVIASGFEDLLDRPFSVELYAVSADVEVDDLIHATEVVAEYGTDVFFGYDASNAQAALRRMHAEDGDGVSHG